MSGYYDALDRLIAMAEAIPDELPADFSQTYRSRKYDGEALYITTDEVDARRAAGWTVEPGQVAEGEKH